MDDVFLVGSLKGHRVVEQVEIPEELEEGELVGGGLEVRELVGVEEEDFDVGEGAEAVLDCLDEVVLQVELGEAVAVEEEGQFL